jgi:hypothetical protein
MVQPIHKRKNAIFGCRKAQKRRAFFGFQCLKGKKLLPIYRATEQFGHLFVCKCEYEGSERHIAGERLLETGSDKGSAN